MKTINFFSPLIKYYKKTVHMMLRSILNNDITEEQALCLSTAIYSKRITLKILVYALFNRVIREKIKDLIIVLDKLGLTCNPIRKPKFINNYRDFLFFSGYLETGLLLQNALEKINPPKKEKSDNHELPGQDLEIYLSVIKQDTTEINNLYSKIYITSHNILKTVFDICDDESIEANDFILIANSSDIEGNSIKLINETKKPDFNTELLVFHNTPMTKKTFDLKKPERSYSFAFKKSLIKNKRSYKQIYHPAILLSLLWHNMPDKDKAKAIITYDFDDGKNHLYDYSHEIPPAAYQFDRLTTRIFNDLLVQQDENLFGGFLSNLPYSRFTQPQYIEISPEKINVSKIIPTEDQYDILMVTDFRIRGGGVKSVLEEATIFKEAGFNVGVFHLDAITLKKISVSFAHGTFTSLSDLNIPILNGMNKIRAKLTILRYPPALAALPTIRPVIDTEKLVIVINQPPKRLATDTPFYDPIVCHKNGTELFSVNAQWWPNGQDAGIAMQEYANEIPISTTNWLNVVKNPSDDAVIENRTARIKDESRPITLGRHTRDVINKWPSTAHSLLQCYPDDSAFTVNILGGADRAKKILGSIPSNWNVWEYGALDVQDYLEDLDFFVFFPHEERIEPMARCIIEAMSAGLPVFLPEKFKDMYGKTPIYCEPEKIIPIIKELTSDTEKYRIKSFETRDEAANIYGPESLIRRIADFGIKPKNK